VCQCQQGHFFKDKSCVPCSDPHCAKCDLTGSTCSSCAGNFKVAPASQQCECPLGDGFYRSNDGLCLPCPEGCERCSSGDSCAQCKAGLLFGATKCVKCSLPSQFITGDSCQSCPQKCLSCDSRTGKCLECAASFRLRQDSMCGCQEGTYFSERRDECAPCMANCDVCFDHSTCVDCAPGFKLVFDGKACKRNSSSETE